MKFAKMHGLGNDYVYVDCFTERISDPAGLARLFSDRHKGIGSDGLILIGPSGKAVSGCRYTTQMALLPKCAAMESGVLGNMSMSVG